MTKAPRGLGKGLSALLGEVSDINTVRQPVGYVNKEVAGTKPVEQVTADIMRIPVDMIEPNPFQPRITFDKEALEELAESVKGLGLIQPITVRQNGNRYQIISGERRFRACKMIGMDMIPAYIRNADDQGMLEMAIVENIQRQDLDPIEVAMSYQRLIDECNLTQEQMAFRVGKKRASITNYLRLLKLPAKVQHDLKVGLLSVGHAKVLLGIEDVLMQEQLCDLVIKEQMSVRQLENKIKSLLSTKPVKVVQDLPENYVRLLDKMGRYFTHSISLKSKGNGKGTMTINFDSDEELQRFLDALSD